MSDDKQKPIVFDQPIEDVPKIYKKPMRAILLSTLDKSLSLPSLKVFNTISLLMDSYVAQKYTSSNDFLRENENQSVRFTFPKPIVWRIFSGNNSRYDYRSLQRGLEDLRRMTFVLREKDSNGDVDFHIDGLINSVSIVRNSFTVELPYWSWRIILDSANHGSIDRATSKRAHLNLSVMNAQIKSRYSYRLCELLRGYSQGTEGVYAIPDLDLKAGLGGVMVKSGSKPKFKKESVSTFVDKKLKRAIESLNKSNVGVIVEHFSQELDFQGDINWLFHVSVGAESGAGVPEHLQALLATVSAKLSAIQCSDLIPTINDAHTLRYIEYCLKTYDEAEKKKAGDKDKIRSSKIYFMSIYRNNRQLFAPMYKKIIEEESAYIEALRDKRVRDEEAKTKERHNRFMIGEFSRWLKGCSQSEFSIFMNDVINLPDSLPRCHLQAREFLSKADCPISIMGAIRSQFRSIKGYTPDVIEAALEGVESVKTHDGTDLIA